MTPLTVVRLAVVVAIVSTSSRPALAQNRFAARYDSHGTESWTVETSFPVDLDALDGVNVRCVGVVPSSLDPVYPGKTYDGDGARAVALDGSGRIVVAGYSRTSTDGRIELARYDSNGNLDSTFNGDGDSDGLHFVACQTAATATALAIWMPVTLAQARPTGLITPPPPPWRATLAGPGPWITTPPPPPPPGRVFVAGYADGACHVSGTNLRAPVFHE